MQVETLKSIWGDPEMSSKEFKDLLNRNNCTLN